MELFKLFGSILIDNDEANKSISETSDKTESLGGKLTSGIKTASKWATAVVGAATAVGGAMVAAAKATADDMDVIDKASQRMKISAESYQELAYAASMSGVEMSVMEQAAKKLEGTDINMDEAMESIMALGTAEERCAAAAELFGEKVAYNMTPLLNVGSEGMAELTEDAHNLGLVFSNETVAAGAAMGDQFANVEQSITALKNSLIAEFMPYVMDILDWVMDYLPVVQEFVKKILDWLMPYVKPILEGLFAFIKGIMALLEGDFDGFVEGIKTLLKNLIPAIFNLGKDIMMGLWNGVKSVWDGIKGWVSEKVEWLKDKLTFWKKSTNDMSTTDGSHAAGLNYVPYDGYTATLHRGETVLNAQDTRGLVDDIAAAIRDAMTVPSGQIVVQSVLDGRVIGETAYNYNRQMARAYNR